MKCLIIASTAAALGLAAIVTPANAAPVDDHKVTAPGEYVAPDHGEPEPVLRWNCDSDLGYAMTPDGECIKVDPIIDGVDGAPIAYSEPIYEDEPGWIAPASVTLPTIAEDDPGWDCRTMGNLICGPGAPHVSEANAWALWDAVGASKLLPDTAVMVKFNGLSEYPITGLTVDQITVWDTEGHHYLFTLSR